MERILRLMDLSSFIHAGHVNKRSNLERFVNDGVTWKSQYTPTGGAAYVFNKMYDLVGCGDIVMCCDRNATIKKEMIPGYKSNRSYDRGVECDKYATEYLLQKAGFTVIARAGYEADDIVYNLWRKHHDEYDKIYIYTADSDYYFMVDEKTEIMPSKSDAKHVTMENYREVAMKDGLLYNCMMAVKIATGDSTDCIPALPKSLQKEFIANMYRDDFYPHMGDKEFMLYWVELLCPECLYQVHNVFPLDMEDSELPTEFAEPSKRMVVNFGDALNIKSFRGHADIDFDIMPYIDEMHSRGWYMEGT